MGAESRPHAADHIRLEPSQFYRGPRPSCARTALLPRSRQRLHRLRQRRTGGHQPDRLIRPVVAAERRDLQLFPTATSEYLSIVFNGTTRMSPFCRMCRCGRRWLRAGPKAADRGRRRSGIIATVCFCRTGRITDVRQYAYDPALASHTRSGRLDRQDGTASAIRTSSLCAS